MRRHCLVGCLGPLDRPTYAPRPNETVTHVDLVAGNSRLGFGVGDLLEALVAMKVFPSELGLDLLVFATLVHAADTRISRATESEDNWTREVRLVIPVSDAPAWSACSPDLQRLLNFLTGDRWTIAFKDRPAGFSAMVPARPPRTPPPAFDRVSLFSGGLDSLIGAIDLLAAGAKPLLISHAGEGATSSAQEACWTGIIRAYPQSSAARLRMWLNVPKPLIPDVASEDTTRGRSFLFFALAACATTGIDRVSTILVPENGLISLNVPLDPLRLGALSTRTTHPFYMARWNDLLAKLGLRCRLDNPYWNKTKGQMVAECANGALLLTLIPESMSCASPAKARWKGRGNEHCGYCLPCIIRRAAIEFALRAGNDPTTYTIPDLRAQALDTLKAEGQQVRSFQLAIARLNANPSLAKILIHKPGPLSDDESRLPDLADVYLRGMREVETLLAGVEATPSE